MLYHAELPAVLWFSLSFPLFFSLSLSFSLSLWQRWRSDPTSGKYSLNNELSYIIFHEYGCGMELSVYSAPAAVVVVVMNTDKLFNVEDYSLNFDRIHSIVLVALFKLNKTQALLKV